MFQNYLNWLSEHDETQETMSFRRWLEMTYPGDTSLHNQTIVAETVAGNLSKASGALATSEAIEGIDTDLAAGLAALARNRFSRIANTMSYVDRVEDRLMRRVNIEEASIDQLLAVGRLLRGSLRDDVTLVAEVVKARDGRAVEQPRSFTFIEQNLNIGDDAANVMLKSRDSRDRSRTIIDSLIGTVKKVASVDSSEPDIPS